MSESNPQLLWDLSYKRLSDEARSDSLYRKMITERDKPFKKFLAREIGRSKPVLDVGANLFSFSYLSHKDVVAVNFSFYGLTNELKYPVNADGLALSFKDGSFPVVLSKNTYGYISEPEQLIKEMIRVLKPKGKFILIDMEGPIRQFNKEIPGLPPRLSDFYPENVAAVLPLIHITKKVLFEGNLRLPTARVPMRVVAVTGLKY